jgi:hypothetical protein
VLETYVLRPAGRAQPSTVIPICAIYFENTAVNVLRDNGKESHHGLFRAGDLKRNHARSLTWSRSELYPEIGLALRD